MTTLYDELSKMGLGVKIISRDLENFHFGINTPTNDNSYFKKLEEYFKLCFVNSPKKCYFHVVKKPCSRFVGKVLMFYKDFCTGKEVHEIVVVYYDVETKNFLTFLKLDQLFPLWSREEFEQAV